MSTLRDTILVARREATERARSKAFIVSTAITVLLIGGGAAAVAMTDTGPPQYRVGIVGTAPAALEAALDAAADATGALVDGSSYADREAVADAFDAGGLDAAIVDGSAILLASDAPAQIEAIVGAALREARFVDALQAAGLTPDALAAILGSSDGVTVVREGSDDGGGGEGVAFAAVVLLFLVITTYGQWVLMGVLEEKSTRVVELVVSSTSVRSLLAGKVLGIGVLGMAQLVLIITLALIGGSMLDLFEIPGGTAPTVAWSLTWFVLGFAFYAVLYAAAGSLVSRTEDAQAVATPVALVGVAGYLLTFAVVVPNPDGLAARILSLVPPVAPVAFPARFAIGDVPVVEAVAGVVIMCATVVGVVRIAARVYAGALLAAGGRIKIREAWNAAGELAAGRS